MDPHVTLAVSHFKTGGCNLLSVNSINRPAVPSRGQCKGFVCKFVKAGHAGIPSVLR